MAVFNVFEHHDRGLDGVELVREGFSSRAFVFTALWALWHRMWVVAALLVASFAIVSLASAYGGLPESVASLVNFGIALVFGFEASSLRGNTLSRAGYRETAIVSGGNLEEAELKHAFTMDRHAQQPTFMVNPPPIQPPTDTLGLFGNV
jgi:hypothetical protein